MKRVIFAIFGSLVIGACGGGGGGGGYTPPASPPAIFVTISPLAQTNLDAGQAKSFTASVENDTDAKGVTWSCSATGSSACGTFTSATTTGATYNAPSSVSGALSVTVTATSVADTTKSSSAKVVVSPPPRITTASLPGGTMGAAYSAPIGVSGGTAPYTWSVTSGALPSGLALQAGTGDISGTPSAAGSFNFTVAVRDSSSSPMSQSQALTLAIGGAGPAGPLAITTSSLTNATPNANYSATLHATGGVAPLTWSLASGALPTGLALSASGAIAGDPTVPGTFTFTVQVADSSTGAGGPATAQAQLSLTVVTPVDIATASLAAGSEGVAYLAQISASGGTAPYTWSVTAGSLPSGIVLEPASGALSGNPASPGNFTFTVEATDSSPTPQSVTQPLTLAIGSPAPLAITTSALLDGTVNVPYDAMVGATGGTPPYAWSITAGALPSSLSLNPATGAIAGTPPSTGTASFMVHVTDRSSAPQAQTQTLNLTVNSAAEACASSGNNAVLAGSYAFSLSGFNDVGFVTVVGSFTADGNGNITAGEADANGVIGAQHGNIIVSGSAYSVGPDHRGCATLATPFGTFAAHFALGAISSNIATAGRMIEWDSPSSSAYVAAGELLLQNSSSFASGPSGSYVFRTVGWDPSAQGGREVCVGVLSASGNTLSGMEEDCNDAWNIISTAIPAVAGTYTSVDAHGRGTGIVTEGATNSNIVFYAASSSQLLEVNANPGPFASGEWDQQSMPAGGAGFTQASFTGNMVFYLNGLTLVNTASTVSLETASADGVSALAINFYEDRAGAMQIPSPLTCTYAVEATGRVTLSSLTQSCGSNIPVLYLTGVNTGFIMDAAPGVDTGSIEPQSAGPFTNASLAGNFSGGIDEVVIQSAQAEVEPVALDGSGNITSSMDFSSVSTQEEASPFAASTYAVNSDGTFSLNSSGGAVAGAIISNTKFVVFSPSTLATTLPGLLVLQK